MGSDLSMNPPAPYRHVVITTPGGRTALYQYQPDAIYQDSDHDWVRRWTGDDNVLEFAFAARITVVKHPVNMNFPAKIDTAEMRNILHPPVPEYVGKHRK